MSHVGGGGVDAAAGGSGLGYKRSTGAPIIRGDGQQSRSSVQRQELLERFNTGEELWIRAALKEGERSNVVAGRVAYVIQEPSCKTLKTPSRKTKWKPPSEVYVVAHGEEVSIMLDGLE